ncbi:MAG: hydroxymethylglutaryl-CoA synthase [Archaeoglobaceae archaeon]|nr:hydroxymethylglutaryl-CoA synthase [Archaeoglobaceae archaeon]MCX8152012.1 hydroxymethylglutaryl-CoA synthase [Archaeoglobaceae archaeon]MDW8013401.1 hydroxymethylglutaryl-CoA synthase [Archaeoglobaceae archaeon]
MIGICSYGTYVPIYRIKIDEIARVWGEDCDAIKNGLGIYEKSVPDEDEDATTIAVEAAREAVSRVKIDPKEIGAIFVGSESHPYAVKPTSTIVGEALGVGNNYFTADLEFACKAGTAAMQICYAMVKAEMIKFGLAIGTDTAQAKPGDALEYSAAAGGAAFLIGKDPIAEIEATYSYTSDTPDFWRRELQPYPSHGGRFTGEPAYFRHIVNAAKGLMEKFGYSSKDFKYAVFHQPNAKFPLKVAKMLGFGGEQTSQSLLVSVIGNTYSASSLIGLCAVLDVAEPDERILLVSFGSGAGSDAFSIRVTDRIIDFPREPKVWDKVSKKIYIDYALYLKHRGKIRI